MQEMSIGALHPQITGAATQKETRERKCNVSQSDDLDKTGKGQKGEDIKGLLKRAEVRQEGHKRCQLMR